MEIFEINIFNIVGNSICVEPEDGHKVYRLIERAMKEGKRIIISFQNIEMLTTAFLNTAIGQLYRDFPEDSIKKSMEVKELSDDGKVKLKRVNRTAKLFYSDPDRLKKSVEEILGE